MNKMVNPYIAGAPVTEVRMFFGREDVFDWIQNSLTGRYADHILVIHGQRRVGKTSVLKQLGNRLPEKYIPVFFDLQGRTHTTLDRFLWWLAREIVRVLKQDRGIEFPLPEKEAFAADPEYFENQFLPSLHLILGGNTLLLTFDEFDNLEETEIKEVLGRPLIDYLRRMMGNKDLNFIFSIGSSGRKLENMQAAYTDFFKTALYKKISFLTEEQTRQLVTQPVHDILEYDRSAINGIYRITGGHPYFTQLTCHELFARCQQTDQRTIREADVEAILDDVVERGTVNLKFVWDEASDIEKWALASLATLDKSDNRSLTAYLRKQNVRFSESDLTTGLLHLREKDILTPENHFVIHLLKLWLQKNRPIEQVREELTEVNPIANRYIEIGLEFKNSGQYEKALESFQQALEVSAGNIQAQVSIALVYIDQQMYDKAVVEFEKALAMDDDDVTARSGLCEAHLALGNAAMEKGRWKEAAQSYQRVLAINEEHTEARQHMAEIQRQRAEKALTDGRDEDALNAFSEAIKYTPEDESLSRRVDAVRAEKKAKVIATQIARSEKETGAKNWEAAIRTLEEARKLAPDDASIQKRLEEVREKLKESKLASLRTKAQAAGKAEKFGEAMKTWQEYLSLEPQDRERAEEEINHLKKSLELEGIYNEAQKEITDKHYDQAISLLKQVIVQDENFKDTSRLLVQAIELRRTAPGRRKEERAKASPQTPRPARQIKPRLISRKWIFGILGTTVVIVLGVFFGPKLWDTLSKDTPSQFPTLPAELASLEPIFAYITATSPDSEDDFSNANGSFGAIAEGVLASYFIKDGVLSLVLEAGSPTEKVALSQQSWMATNFVLEFDFYFEDSTGGVSLIDVGFPSTGKGDKANGDVRIEWDSENFYNFNWSIGLTDRSIDNSGALNESLQGRWSHLQVVYAKDQLVAFLNGKLLGHVEGIGTSGGEPWIVATTSGQANIRLDNVRYWNLDPLIYSTTAPTSTPSLDPAIQTALETTLNEAPLYQTTFDSWEFVESYGNARIENGKLIIDGKNTEAGSGIVVSNHTSDRYAVEFEFRILETVKDGCGFVGHNNVDPSEESRRIIGAGFSSPNGADLGYHKYPDQWIFLSNIETTFDFSETNKVTLIILGDQITAFINGQLIYSAQNPLGSAIHTQQQLLGGQVVCEYDNFKYWDLRTRNEITVTSAEDSGPGTLRQAILDAQAGEVIKFEPNVFPPNKPTTIYLTSELPRITQGDIMIDASNAGVILDGTGLPDNSFGLIISSDRNTIMGLQMFNFPGIAMYIEGVSYNVIGGDRSIGAGPIGRGNMVSFGPTGIDLLAGGGGNIITGNIMEDLIWGIIYEGDPPYNPAHTITGPNNIIAHNKEGGIRIDSGLVSVTITANSINDNEGPGINYTKSDAATEPPVILYFDLASGTVNGSTCKDCVVEIFSTDTKDGKVYEGTVTADAFGNFSFNKGEALSGPFLTATTTHLGGNTSEFSQPTSSTSAIQIALDATKNNKPLYQTSFDSWDSGWNSRNDARVENGKLILASTSQEGVVVGISNLTSDRYAVEFDVKIEASPEGICVFENANQETGKSWKGMSAIFASNGQADFLRSVDLDTDTHEQIAVGDFDANRTNTVLLTILGDQIAAFINGQIAYTAINPNGSVVYIQQQLSAYGTTGCEFDNYKIWDLSAVDFSAKTTTTEPTTFESILTSITDKAPDYEDYFSNLESGWSTDRNSTGNEYGYQDGETYIISAKNGCYGPGLPNNRVFSDFVLETDVRFINQDEGVMTIGFRGNDSAHYGANISPLGWVYFHKNINGVHVPLLETEVPKSSFQAWGTPKHLTLVARQNRMALYVNGELALELTDNSSSEGAFNFMVCSNVDRPLQAVIDNLKIWDITDLSP